MPVKKKPKVPKRSEVRKKKVGGVKSQAVVTRQVGDEYPEDPRTIYSYDGRERTEIHRRAGIRLPGSAKALLEEATHYLAQAACDHAGHFYSPCTTCLLWADQQLTSILLARDIERGMFS